MKKPALKDVFTKSNMRCFMRSLLMDAIGSIFFGFGIYNFVSAADFAPGGVSGIAIIVNYWTNLPIGLATLIVNIPIILISFKTLGKRYLARTFQTVVVNTIFLDLICPLFPKYHGSRLLAALFAGAIVGVGLAIIYHNGSNTGGSDLIIMSLRRKKPHMSIGQITIFIDGLIILIGGITYGDIDAILYGFLYTAAMTAVIDKLMYGFVSGKLVLIVTDPVHTDEIKTGISEKLKRGVTILKGRGGYTKTDKEVLMCACSRAQLTKLHKMIKGIDDKIMMIVTSYDEVFGEGFSPFETLD